MSSAYEGLDDTEIMQLSIALRSAQKPRELHQRVQTTRDYIDGLDEIIIPKSHRSLLVGQNHEGGHRLNVRIEQGAAWLSSAKQRFRVQAGSEQYRNAAAQMAKFAQFGEERLGRGTQLHKWAAETNRDLFESGVSIIQHNPRRDFYVKATADVSLMVKGPKLEELFFRRRVDPLYFEWEEDVEGNIGADQIAGRRTVGRIARIMDKTAYDQINGSFTWAESLNDRLWASSGESIETRELWTPDRGVLIITAASDRGPDLAQDDPRRIVASWKNTYGCIPHYITTASPWPWVSPLDEMIALTGSRNYWATMLDHQASGAIFRQWQLKDTNTGADVAPSLWANPVAEAVLLDISKPPPNMGAGTEWVLAPFEMHDVIPRLQMIVAQHEAAGAAVARLMGEIINQNTAVGTADMIEDFARREHSLLIEAFEDTKARVWEDTFRYIKRMHTKEPVRVSGRMRDPKEMEFFQTTLELKGSDIVAEDVFMKADTRSRMAQIADYKLGREMRTNGDMSFNRAADEGLLPYIDNGPEEKVDIFEDQIENVSMETEILGHQRALAQNLGLMQQQPGPNGSPVDPSVPGGATTPSIGGGARPDPRSNGVGQGADNIVNTSLSSTGAA